MPPPDTAARVVPEEQKANRPAQPNLANCVAELEQLKIMFTREVARRHQAEQAVSNAEAELALARAELLGTQAGERRARHLALHDSLTALPNRNFFRERLDHELVYAESQRQALALLYLDLDGFKPLNDTHGHDAGDEMLKIVAARLARAVRADDMVSRLGGDEFACLLSGLPSRDRLGSLACKIFEVVSAPLKLGEIEVSVRPSIGIAVSPTDGHTAEVLLKNADAAMYRAKRRKTGYAFFDESGADYDAMPGLALVGD
jgi:diguanylate cyclase (GGDEF)-like protein